MAKTLARKPLEGERRDVLAELQSWYLGSLGPKLAHAASAGTVAPAAAVELDRQLRALLRLTDERRAARPEPTKE